MALLKTGPLPQLLLSKEAKAVAGSSISLSLPYGVPVAFGLLPCASAGNIHTDYNLHTTSHHSCSVDVFTVDVSMFCSAN